jgi:hypothetical protein
MTLTVVANKREGEKTTEHVLCSVEVEFLEALETIQGGAEFCFPERLYAMDAERMKEKGYTSVRVLFNRTMLLMVVF